MVASSSFKRIDEDDLIVLDCKIGNVSAKIALDTGASHTVIDFGRLIEAGYRMGDTKGIVPIATANGIIGANLFLLKHFEVFGIVKQNFLVTSYLLGLRKKINYPFGGCIL
jgi:hypothetical protein